MIHEATATQFSGERVLITGGTRGFGHALARELQARGARVMVVGRDRQVVEAVAKAGEFVAYRADVTREADRRRALEVAADELGGLTMLVNNAATQTAVDLVRLGADEANSSIERELVTDLLAPIALTIDALPLLRSLEGSRVVFVSSALGFAPKRSAPAYCAAKAGLDAFATALRYQLEVDAPNVSSVVVTLPLVDTAMTAGRGRGKLAPQTAAAATARGIARGATRIDIGRARILRALHHAVPPLAAAVTRDS